ncbi:MAG: anion permease [Saprospiraceae bacterium]|nr:anion permease [Candidatus Vicinibacter affinis]
MNKGHKELYGALVILFILGLHYYLNPWNADARVLRTVTVAFLMISFWVMDFIPLAVVALFPLVLFPLLGIESLDNTARHYADPIIFLFMGGFFLALAIEKWNLHQRIALNILRLTGSNGDRIILGFMLSTFCISMWISNTATTMMMFPIALSVINLIQKTNPGMDTGSFAISIMLTIAYASNIGGLSTIIGTPPNVAYVGFLRDTAGIEISFMRWMMICLPVALVLLFFLYVLFTRILFKNNLGHQESTAEFIRNKIKQLGVWSVAEKRVMGVFCLAAFMWITKDLWVNWTGLPISDTMIAITAGITLFILPSGTKTTTTASSDEEEDSAPRDRILIWSDTHKMSWGILLMFGGGLTLAKGLEQVGVMKSLGEHIAFMAPSQEFLLILMVTTVSIFLSEIMSNVAQVIVMAPIITAVALNLQLDPLLLGIPMTLAASCAGMLPMGTPPNAIVFSSGKIPLRKMLRAGFFLNLMSIVVITVLCYALIRLK